MANSFEEAYRLARETPETISENYDSGTQNIYMIENTDIGESRDYDH